MTLRLELISSRADIEDGTNGRCIHCGAEAHGVEPDARNYTCESCGQAAVFGLGELLLMGILKIAGQD